MIDQKIAPNKEAALEVIQLVKEENKKQEDDLKRAPKYFQALFQKYPILKKFNIREIMTKNYVRQFFLTVAKQQIYDDVNSAKLARPELKEIMINTKFPIVFVIVGTIKSILRLVSGFSLNPYFQAVKFTVYYLWLSESLKINTRNYRLQKRVRLYKELQDEVSKLANII